MPGIMVDLQRCSVKGVCVECIRCLGHSCCVCSGKAHAHHPVLSGALQPATTQDPRHHQTKSHADELGGCLRRHAGFAHAASIRPDLVRYEELPLAAHKQVLPLASLAAAGQGHSNAFSEEVHRPSALLVFGEHAREIITTELCIWLAKAMLGDGNMTVLAWPETVKALREAGLLSVPSSPPGDSKAAAAADTPQEEVDAPVAVAYWSAFILARLTLHMLPVENMDGRAALEGGDLCRRKTAASNVDLNRNWPFAWQRMDAGSDMYGGPYPLSEPQARKVRELADRWRPTAFINVHSGEWAVYTPWDSKASTAANLPPDLASLVSDMGRLCDCQAGPAGAVSNYLAFGTSMDWFHTALHTPYPLTLELYGSGNEGKLRGKTNKPLFEWPVEGPTGRHRSQQQQQQQQQHPSQPAAGAQVTQGMHHRALHHSQHHQESGTHLAVTDRGRPLSPPPSYVDLKAQQQQQQEQEEEQQVGLSEPDDSRQLMSADAGAAAVQASALGAGLGSDPLLDLVKSSRAELRGCFEMFNPMSEPEYRQVVGRWLAILLHTLRHVASHAHEHGHDLQAAQSRGKRMHGLAARRHLPAVRPGVQRAPQE